MSGLDLEGESACEAERERVRFKVSIKSIFLLRLVACMPNNFLCCIVLIDPNNVIEPFWISVVGIEG